MSRIDDLIAQHCPDGVEFKSIADIARRNKGIQVTAAQMKARHVDGAPIRVFAAGNTVAQLREEDVPVASVVRLPSIIVKSRGHIGFAFHEGPFTHKSEMWSYTFDPAVADSRFMYHYLLTRAPELQEWARATSVKLPQLSVGDTDRLKVPVPPLAIQREIASILDKMERLKVELEAELEYRSRQYAFYRDQLLAFDGVEGVRWVPMGEALAMRAGQHLPASQILAAETEGWHVPVFGGNGLRGYGASASHSGPHILVGRQGALCGNVRRVDGDFYATEHAVVGKTGSDLDTNFAYHLLTQMDLNQYKSSGAQPGLAVSVLANIKVPIPALDVQVRIASLLDRFDALVNDLSIGLPAEIAARQKQYDYYRDKLLTFPEKEAS